MMEILHLRKLTRLAVFVALALCAFQLHAQSTTADYVATGHSVILTQMLNAKGFTNKSVEMMIVDFPPKSKSPAHRHPCPTFGYVISGNIVSVFEGKTYQYKAGDSFYETPNGLHSDARNDGDTPAKLLVIYIKDDKMPTVMPAN
jgi:quercetin dioxygenase-like cupin family protein